MIKISRADLLADLAKPEKRQSYSAIAEQVFYVAPEGIAQAVDIPEGYGLLLETEPGCFKVDKRAKKKVASPSASQFMALILKRGQFEELGSV